MSFLNMISFKQFYNEDGKHSIVFVINGEELIVSDVRSELRAKEAVRRLNEHIEQNSGPKITILIQSPKLNFFDKVAIVDGIKSRYPLDFRGGYDAKDLMDAIETASQESNKVARALMQEFVDRVDKGEIRSVQTYKKFKDFLNG